MVWIFRTSLAVGDPAHKARVRNYFCTNRKFEIHLNGFVLSVVPVQNFVGNATMKSLALHGFVIGFSMALTATNNSFSQTFPNPGQTRWWIVKLNVSCTCHTRAFIYANAINDCGEVVGEADPHTDLDPDSDCPRRPWLWTVCDTIQIQDVPALQYVPARCMQDLGLLVPGMGSLNNSGGLARTINNDAVVGGGMIPEEAESVAPYWWDLRVLTLNQLPCSESNICWAGTASGGFISLTPGQINDISDGVNPLMVGTFGELNTPNSAQAWRRFFSNPTDVVNLPPIFGESEAWAANYVGTVPIAAGFSEGQAMASGFDNAVVWDLSQTPLAPVPLPEPLIAGIPQWMDRAYGGNGSQDYCGTATRIAGGVQTVEAIVWDHSGGIGIEVGSLFPQTNSFARAITERDLRGDIMVCGDGAPIVGDSSAYVWWTRQSFGFDSVTNGTTTFYGANFNATAQVWIRELFPSGGPSSEGLKLRELRGINNLGWMVGVATIGGSPRTYAVLVLPSPCQADFDDNLVVDGTDLTTLLTAWGACDANNRCVGDINDDRNVDALDLAYVLSAWGQDCNLDMVCNSLNCRGGARPALGLAPAVVEVLERYGHHCPFEFCEWLRCSCDAVQRIIVDDIATDLGVDQ